jgi:hypothetical protein
MNWRDRNNELTQVMRSISDVVIVVVGSREYPFVLKGTRILESGIRIPDRDEHTLARNGLDDVGPSIALARWAAMCR